MALFTLSLLSVWQFGSSMVLFLAALKQVPEDLYEAARIDGAGHASIFFRVTLPMITPVLFFNILMQMVHAFQDFSGPFVITKGGPLHATYLFALKLYDEAFLYFKMGYASSLLTPSYISTALENIRLSWPCVCPWMCRLRLIGTRYWPCQVFRSCRG
jgi:oligogalacturonide transport system permease protein